MSLLQHRITQRAAARPEATAGVGNGVRMT